VKSCVDSALQLGLPEARIPLAEAIILLATAPKSNSAEAAIDAALADLKSCDALDFPRHLQNKHTDGEGAAIRGQHYLYPHDYKNHYVRQQYLPDALKDRIYYNFGQNKQEQSAYMYRKKILEECEMAQYSVSLSELTKEQIYKNAIDAIVSMEEYSKK
jgi:putative ATPase